MKTKLCWYATVVSLCVVGICALLAQELTEDLPPVVMERQLVVLDQDGQPVPDATVLVNVSDLEPTEVLSDADGVARFPYLDRAGVTIYVSGNGYVPLRWTPAVRGADLPEHLEFVLRPGMFVGGTVIDEDGEPIENAEVRMSCSERRGGSQIPDGPYADIVHHIVHTDADGNWEADIFPRSWTSLAIWISHPDYVVWTFAAILEPERALLVSGEWEVTLHRGVKLDGVVRDENARPIAGAAIAYGPRRESDLMWDVIHTDEEGRFTLGAMPPGNYSYVVVAKGYTPRRFATSANTGTPPLRVRLSEGQQLSVQFVDEDQNPVEDVRVRIWGWTGEPAAFAAGIGRELDEEGRWFWDGMPSEPFELRVYSDDYVTEEFPITPDRTEYVFTLESAQKVRYDLRVVDAESGDPVERIEVFAFSEDLPLYEYHARLGSDEGQYSYEVPTPYGPSSLEIRSEGYAGQTVGHYTLEDSPVTLEVELAPLPSPRDVCGPDASPASVIAE